MLVSFELTMPNVGSWNGRWSGASSKHYLIRKLSKDGGEEVLQNKNYYYNFGDGWGANITVEKVDSVEAAKRRKISKGFCGYEWMIDSILKYGKIVDDVK